MEEVKLINQCVGLERLGRNLTNKLLQDLILYVFKPEVMLNPQFPLSVYIEYLFVFQEQKKICIFFLFYY